MNTWLRQNKADSLSALGVIIGLSLTVAASELEIPLMAVIGAGAVALMALFWLARSKRTGGHEEAEGSEHSENTDD